MMISSETEGLAPQRHGDVFAARQGAPRRGKADGSGLRRHAPRVLAALAAAAAGLWLARDRLAELDPAALGPALAAISPWTLVAAAICGLLSHLAVAGYDLPALGRVGRRLPLGDALRGGFAAGALAQSLGLGPLTGGLARWRMHRGAGMGGSEAAAVTGLVCLGFYAGLACLLLPAALLAPGLGAEALGVAPADLRVGAGLVTAALIAGALAAPRLPALRLGRKRIALPGGRWLAGAAALTAADLIPASLALWLLLPQPPSFAEFALVYAAAIGIGLATGAPGGVGLFEALMLGAFPHLPAAEMAAALLLYRAVYHGPALAIGLRLLARAPRRSAEAADPAALRDALEWAAEDGARAEAELAFLGDKHVLFDETGGAFVMYGVRGRWRIVMGEPHGDRGLWPALMDRMEREARAEGRRVAVYKAEQAAAQFWKDRGMHLQKLGEEAVLDPQGFAIEGKERRELRRKLTKTAKSGLEISFHAPGEAPLVEMSVVAAAWEAAKPGAERGFSMGTWDRNYVSRHHVAAARLEGRLVGFVTFWRAGRGGEWSLDLMRQTDCAPDGTMLAMIARGIEEAKADGAHRFSLCMAPLSGLEEESSAAGRALELIYRRSAAGKGLQGLRRFKQIFRPEWEARHLAVPAARHAPGALAAAALLVRGAAQSAPPPRIAGRPEAAPASAMGRGAVVVPFRRRAVGGLVQMRERAARLRRRAG